MSEETNQGMILEVVVEEGPCVMAFAFRWKEDDCPRTDEERRVAVLTAIDALHREITRPWVDGL